MNESFDIDSYQLPTEYVMNNASVNFNINKSILRARSHKYPDRDEKYVDTTYYDKEDGILDLGYQRLRKLIPDYYPEFSYLKKIYIDHNNLSYLPDAKLLPNLEQLTCSSNCLSEIPFYPKITFLNISNNSITNCQHYDKTSIEYFDCSHNIGFKMNFLLPKCKHLYINNTELKYLNLELFPVLEFLDCGDNKLTEITSSNSLVEINIQYNRIRNVPDFPNLVRLMVDYNEVEILNTYPKMLSLNITHNKLIEIKYQPSLKKLIANNNRIEILGNMPKLELVDLRYNNIAHFDVSNEMEYISIQFNPLTELFLGPIVLGKLKELQVNFKTYRHIYEKYYNYFDAVNIQTNEEKLEQLLKKLDKIFNDSITRYVFRQFNNIKFKKRKNALFKITLKLYHTFYSLKGINSMQELINTNKFKNLFYNMTKFYYKTIVITLYFNGYHD